MLRKYYEAQESSESRDSTENMVERWESHVSFRELEITVVYKEGENSLFRFSPILNLLYKSYPCVPSIFSNTRPLSVSSVTL